jgi:hypothetical protein
MQAGVAVLTGFRNRVAVLFNWLVAGDQPIKVAPQRHGEATPQEVP